MTSDLPPPTAPEHRPASVPPEPAPAEYAGASAGSRGGSHAGSAAGAADGSAIVAVSLDSATRAQEFLLAMRRLREAGSLAMTDAVVVTKNNDGQIRVVETVDPTPARSALSGAVWTGLLGLLLGGPIGWLAGLGVGAGGGAIAAKVIDLGIPDEWVDWFKQAVQPGTSTVVVLVDDVDVRALTKEAARFKGAELLHTTLPLATWNELDHAFESGSAD